MRSHRNDPTTFARNVVSVYARDNFDFCRPGEISMTTTKLHPRILKFCAWTGPLFTLWWLLGAGPLAWFILPPVSAANTAAQTVADYTDNLTSIRVGCVLMIFSSMIYCAFGMAITLYTRQAEGHRPVLFYIQVVSLACCEVVVMLIGFFWGAAAWRPGETDPAVTQALNDLGWLGVLFTGAPFLAYMLAVAVAILLDESARPAFPRWIAYFNLFVSFWMFEACFLLFFKHGAFSQNGLMVFYVPMIVFFTWILVMSTMTIKAINNETAELAAAERDRLPEMSVPDTPVLA